MPEYRVTWEIEVEASSHRDAAAQALAIQRDPESSAVVFGVRRLYHHHDGVRVSQPHAGSPVVIDLDAEVPA